MATIDTEGNRKALDDHFPTLQWLLDQIYGSRTKFLELARTSKTKQHREVFTWLAGCADQAWEKCEKYYNKTDESAAYYAAVVLNPELKYAWFKQEWKENEEAQKNNWLAGVKEEVEALWQEEYRGKYRVDGTQNRVQPAPVEPRGQLALLYEKKANYKRIRLSPTPTASSTSPPPRTDQFHEYCETNLYKRADGEHYEPISYWQERYNSMRDLARFALDMLAIPPMADACERLFSSAKLLLTDRRSRLKMDVIEANECLRSFYGPPQRGSFDDAATGILEDEAGEAIIEEGGEQMEGVEEQTTVVSDGESSIIEVENTIGSDIEDVVYSDSEDELDLGV